MQFEIFLLSIICWELYVREIKASFVNRTLPRILYLEKKRQEYPKLAPWNRSRNLSLPPIISQRRHNNESQVSMKAKRERKRESRRSRAKRKKGRGARRQEWFLCCRSWVTELPPTKEEEIFPSFFFFFFFFHPSPPFTVAQYGA